MNEASKAMRRRYREHHTPGGFPWMTLFRGRGLDVGCGPDKLPFAKCEPFDKEHGDASDLTKYFPNGAFSYLHASQVLEHVDDPLTALQSWVSVVKPRGYLIVSVPDWGLYERFNWPSKYNPDHRTTWSLVYPKSSAPKHIYVPEFLEKIKGASVKKIGLVDTNYNYANILKPEDQTQPESRGVEAFIEFVLQKSNS